MDFVDALGLQSKGAASRNQVLLALMVSVVLHAIVFQAWPHMQGSPQREIIVDGELLPPVVTESPKIFEPPAPEPKQEPPKKPAPVKPKLEEQPPQTSKPDTGVALPVIADKSEAPTSASDFVVADATPLNADEKLPFGSRTGTVPLSQYTPTDGPPSEENPDTEDKVDADALGEFAQTLRDRAAQSGSYPAIAKKRGWQGKAKVLVKFNSDGTPRQILLKDSSGHTVLDDQALEMVRKACGGIVMPGQLAGKKFSVVVPVNFSLQG